MSAETLKNFSEDWEELQEDEDNAQVNSVNEQLAEKFGDTC